MKYLLALYTTLVILAVLASGCTSSTSPASATPAPAQVTQSVAITPSPAVTTSTPSITGTTWTLGWFDDTKGMWSKVAEGSTVTLTIGANGRLTGSGGCNDYSAEYHLGTDPMIWIRRPEIGTKTCQAPTGVMNQESAYYTDLSWAEDYAITNNQLVMFDKTGKKILQFDPA